MRFGIERAHILTRVFPVLTEADLHPEYAGYTQGHIVQSLFLHPLQKQPRPAQVESERVRPHFRSELDRFFRSTTNMSTVYLGLAASAGAAAVVLGRRLSVKFGGSAAATESDAAAADATPAAADASGSVAKAGAALDPADDLTEIVIDSSHRNGHHGHHGHTTRDTLADGAFATPPATPVKPMALQLEPLDPISIPKRLPVLPLPATGAAAGASLAPLGAIAEGDDGAEGHHHHRRGPRRPVSQEVSALSDSENEDDASAPAPVAPAPLARRHSSLNLMAPAFVPSPTVSRAASPDSGSDQTEEGGMAPKKIRCAYWPRCRSAASCPYWHPLERCKNEENKDKFPNGCVYGTRCFFYHDSESDYLASMGVYPPYQRSRGIGPNTPPSVSGGLVAGSGAASPIGRRASAMLLPSQRSAPLAGGPAVTPADVAAALASSGMLGAGNGGAGGSSAPVAMGFVQPYYSAAPDASAATPMGYLPFGSSAPGTAGAFAAQQVAYGLHPQQYQHHQYHQQQQYGYATGGIRKQRSMSMIGSASSDPAMGAGHATTPAAFAPGYGAPRHMRSSTNLRGSPAPLTASTASVSMA
ncbi:hypothetical protein BC828DRAFT_391524 [Blastocladiella britannica]|nr:hypothetical protein BC828DRAFT_391524 [Blastocladiella britannica]